jgi:preprotein translocase subunit SecG
MVIAWVGMIISYLLTNLSLLAQVLGLTSHPVSHKTDYVYRAEQFWQILFDGFVYGRDHSVSYHQYILTVAIVILILYRLSRPHEAMADSESKSAESLANTQSLRQHLAKIIIFLVTINFIFALIAAIWNSAPGVLIRNRIEIFGTFQLTRVLWIAPAIWYLILALAIAFILLPEQKAIKAISISVVLIATILTTYAVLMANNLKPNIQKLLNPEYPAISYSDYYALNVLDQVEAFIREQTGLTQAEYRVVSLGINPAAALYHGFYCLDGYSNNYPLEYKQSFRRIIAAELDKNEIDRYYFEYWGNRCYLSSAEEEGTWPIRKGSFIYRDLSLNTKALIDMGGRYLLSAAYIENAEAAGLILARAEPFETPESYSRIYLYEIQ